jgi:hypothetical protein
VQTRPESDRRIYCTDTGYIPVRIHQEISGQLNANDPSRFPSASVRGPGENDWYQPRNDSEALRLDALRAPDALVREARKYSGGDQHGGYVRQRWEAFTGWSATALAFHGANLAAARAALEPEGSPARFSLRFNFLGHSRGAVECIQAAWFLYAYGPRDIPVNIFAIDPVPGPGQWYGILTQLPPNVANYVGIYAWDHLDTGFMGLVPRPNGPMTGQSANVRLGATWDTLADNYQLADPLAPGSSPQPAGYELYACRGKHGTVAGNTTADGGYDPNNLNTSVAAVPKLVYKAARGYLTRWGTPFLAGSGVKENALALRRQIHTDHAKFDAMGGGATRTSTRPGRPYVRQVSSISGRDPSKYYYLDDVVGDPPYKLAYPVTTERQNAGWVKWKFL